MRALAMAAVLAGCGGGVAHAQLFGPRGPSAVAFAAHGAADAPTHTTIQDLAQLKGVKKVVIAQFQLEFVELSQGLSARQRDNVKMDYAIAPLADAERQALADKLYARFKAGLEAQGVTVQGWEGVTAAASGAKLQKIAKPAGDLIKTDMGRMRMFTAGASPYYLAPGDMHLGSNAGMAWNFSNSPMAETALAFESGAAVMRVRMIVGLRDIHRSSKLFAVVRTASSMIGEPQLVVQGLGTELVAQPPGKSAYDYRKPAVIKIKDDLLFEEDLLEGKTRIADGAGSSTSNVAAKALFVGGVMASMVGGGGAALYQSHKVECTPDPAAHLAAVDRNLSAVGDMMLARLQNAW